MDRHLKSNTAKHRTHSLYQALQLHIDYYWKNGLIDLRKPGTKLPQGHDHANALGYVGVANKVLEIWLSGPRFDKIAGGVREARLLKHKLAHLGLLSTWASRNQSPKSVVRRSIPGFEKEWVVAIKLPKMYAKRSMRLGLR